MGIRPLALFCCMVWLLLPSVAQQSSSPKSRKELDRGTAQYKKERYKEATASLMKAVQLDPDSTEARLYLAKALTQQYDPDVDTRENSAFATRANEQFQELLRLSPQDVESLKGFAGLLVRMQKREEARRYYEQALAMNPKDAESYKGIGQIDWWAADRKFLEAREKAHYKYSGSPITDASCTSVRAATLPLLDASIAKLAKAFDLADDDETTATFLSWAYTRRADLECHDPETREQDLKLSNTWLQLAGDAHRKKPNQPPPFKLVSL